MTISKDDRAYTVSLDLQNASMSNDNDYFTIWVMDYNSRKGYGEGFVVQSYTKVVKISSKLAYLLDF